MTIIFCIETKKKQKVGAETRNIYHTSCGYAFCSAKYVGFSLLDTWPRGKKEWYTVPQKCECWLV